ncbi:MAG: hypothetical protein HYY16_04445 [Planctomycetes bacterium]|nr:hypothetical protein [Planctomycetota bacterium]
MAKQIKCPRCRFSLDAGTLEKGAIIPCPQCGVSMRVPTGETERVPVKAAAVPEGKPDPMRHATPIFHKMATAKPTSRGGHSTARRARRRSNTTPLVIVMVAGAVTIFGVMIFLISDFSQSPKNDRKTEPATSGRSARVTAPPPEPETPEEPAKPADKKPPSLRKTEAGTYEAPAQWEPGATRLVDPEAKPIAVEPAVAKEAEDLLRKRDHRAIVAKAERYLAPVINLLAGDDETLARSAFDAMHLFCEEKELRNEETQRNPVNLALVNSARYRASEFEFWSFIWYPKNRDKLGPLKVVHAPIDPKNVDWERLMQDLRPGGGYDEPTRPEGQAMEMLKRMGRDAYPKLVEYIMHEDLGISRAATAALQHLTGHSTPMPREDNRATVRTLWQEWLSKN